MYTALWDDALCKWARRWCKELCKEVYSLHKQGMWHCGNEGITVSSLWLQTVRKCMLYQVYQWVSNLRSLCSLTYTYSISSITEPATCMDKYYQFSWGYTVGEFRVEMLEWGKSCGMRVCETCQLCVSQCARLQNHVYHCLVWQLYCPAEDAAVQDKSTQSQRSLAANFLPTFMRPASVRKGWLNQSWPTPSSASLVFCLLVWHPC